MLLPSVYNATAMRLRAEAAAAAAKLRQQQLAANNTAAMEAGRESQRGQVTAVVAKRYSDIQAKTFFLKDMRYNFYRPPPPSYSRDSVIWTPCMPW
jgi:hypothetical protein